MNHTPDAGAPSEQLRERLEAMRDQLIVGLARSQHLDNGYLQLLGTVGFTLQALKDAPQGC